MAKEFYDISIRGRLAYGMTCLEKMVDFYKCNDDLLNTIVFPRIWTFTTSTDLSEWEESVKDIDPFFVLDAKHKPFDFTTLRNDVFLNIKALYEKLPDFILTTISNVIEIGGINLYSGIVGYAEETLNYLNDVIKTMIKHKIPLPAISTFKKAKFIEFHGWGDEQKKSYYTT